MQCGSTVLVQCSTDTVLGTGYCVLGTGYWVQYKYSTGYEIKKDLSKKIDLKTIGLRLKKK
jgi:hypothetical protein